MPFPTADIRICPICDAPYFIFSMTIAEQKYCAKCADELERRAEFPTEEEKKEQDQKREFYFNSVNNRRKLLNEESS